MTESESESGAEAAAIRASDTEREDIAEMLGRHYAEGRLTFAELDERQAAAHAAVTRDQLTELLADLPAEPEPDPDRAQSAFDPRLLWLLVCVCPPAGLVYWLYYRGVFA